MNHRRQVPTSQTRAPRETQTPGIHDSRTTADQPQQKGANVARIIAIDDEQAILDAIERILKRDGHDVLCLADPTSALKLNLA